MGFSHFFLYFLEPSMCRYQDVEGPGNWDSGPGVVDVCVISANRAVSPIRVDCQCPRKVSQVHNRGKSFTPLSDRLPFFSAQFFSRLTAGVQSVCFCWVEFRLSVPWELGSLFICLCAWARGRQTERQADDLCVCERECEGRRLFGGCLNGFSRALLNGMLPPVVFLSKKLFCFEKNNWAFHRKLESTDNLPAALKDAHTHTQTHRSRPDAWVGVCHLCLIQRWDIRQCYVCYFVMTLFNAATSEA